MKIRYFLCALVFLYTKLCSASASSYANAYQNFKNSRDFHIQSQLSLLPRVQQVEVRTFISRIENAMDDYLESLLHDNDTFSDAEKIAILHEKSNLLMVYTCDHVSERLDFATLVQTTKRETMLLLIQDYHSLVNMKVAKLGFALRKKDELKRKSKIFYTDFVKTSADELLTMNLKNRKEDIILFMEQSFIALQTQLTSLTL